MRHAIRVAPLLGSARSVRTRLGAEVLLAPPFGIALNGGSECPSARFYGSGQPFNVIDYRSWMFRLRAGEGGSSFHLRKQLSRPIFRIVVWHY